MAQNLTKFCLGAFFLSLILQPVDAEMMGSASWRGTRYHGQTTASGQVYDMNTYTAAHASLPLGQKVKVTSQKTNKSIVVTINDRLNPNSGRIIDVSKKAAEEIGLIREGIGQVSVEVLSGEIPVTNSPSSISSDSSYIVQYGSFSKYDNAYSLQQKLAAEGVNVTINNENGMYKVTSQKEYSTEEQAKCHISLFSPGNGMVVASSEVGSATMQSVQSTGDLFQIQYGSFSSYNNAQQLQSSLKMKGIETEVGLKDKLFRVISLSKFNSKEQATALLSQNPSVYGIVVPEMNFGSASTTTTTTTVNNSTVEDDFLNSSNDAVTGQYEYGIQYGAFDSYDNAQKLSYSLSRKGVKSIVYQFPNDTKKLHRVLSHKPFISKEDANLFLKQHNISPNTASVLAFQK